jgi:RNA polymerase sigma factor (sigma-70 family)
MSTKGNGSVSYWIDALKNPDDDKDLAAQRLWDHYFDELVRQARVRLQDAPRAPADEEDIALSAFMSVCTGAVAGRFPNLDDRNELGRLLAIIIKRKVFAHIRNERAKRRGGGKTHNDPLIDRNADEGPTPAVVALANVEVRRLFSLLRNDSLREVVRLRMEGYSNEEIGKKLGCTERTVERKLDLVRQTWRKEVDDDG